MQVFRALMDGVSLMATYKIALQRTVVALKWARMKLKSQKSRSLLIKGEKYINEKPFHVAGEIIPSNPEEPLKTLGRVYNSNVTDRQAQDNLKKKINELVQIHPPCLQLVELC